MSGETQTDPRGRWLFLKAAVLSAALLGIQAAGSLAPSGLFWGVHAFGFLPPAHLFVSLAVLGAVILVCSRWDPALPLARASRWTERKPVAAILLGSGILAVCAILRRASIPILGDGYTVINNFRNTVTGVHPLSTSHEPLGMAFFYFIGQILRVTGGWSPTDAILAGDILLIVVFIACAVRTVRELFPGEVDGRRTLTLLFILSVPYLQLFFGYVGCGNGRRRGHDRSSRGCCWHSWFSCRSPSGWDGAGSFRPPRKVRFFPCSLLLIPIPPTRSSQARIFSRSPT
jgi:hypothetical protein